MDTIAKGILMRTLRSLQWRQLPTSSCLYLLHLVGHSMRLPLHYLSWKNLNEPLLISRQLLLHADFSGSVGLVPVYDPRWIALSNGPNRSWERMRRPAWSARSVHSWKTRAHAVFPNLVALSYECSSSALQDESLLPQLSM
jgi:hypothetical protein